MHSSIVLVLFSYFACSYCSTDGHAQHIAAPPARIDTLAPKFFHEYGSQRVKFSYGPYSVQSMQEYNGMSKFVENPSEPPCTDCLITWIQAGLEFPDGTVADSETGMWLHHTVFSSLGGQNAVCPKKHGDRFFASGNERTPVDISRHGTDRAGYYIGPDDTIAMTTELMSMIEQPRDAVLTVIYEFIPSVPRGFDKVSTYWLDIGGCGSSSFPAKNREHFSYSSPLWNSQSHGRITAIGGHLHDGGSNLEIFKNGNRICNTKAVYGRCDKRSPEIGCTGHIDRMTTCNDLGSVEPGDEWTITAHYDTVVHVPMKNMDGSLEPVMGICLVYVAETYMSRHRTQKFLLAAATFALLISMAFCWRMRNSSTMRDVFHSLTRRFYRPEEPRDESSMVLLSGGFYEDEE